MPRANAYRWEEQLRWWHESGQEELAALRRERAELLAEVACLRVGKSCVGVALSREAEWSLVVEAAVLGTSDEEIAALVRRAGGRSLTHQTIAEMLAAAAAVGRVAYERHFAGVGRVGAADEIFLGSDPLLLVVGPLSLLISGLRRAEEAAEAEVERARFCGGKKRGMSAKSRLRHARSKASTGSWADQVELTVLAVLDEGIRSSSYVECVNSRVRLVQVARKRMSEDFICLLAVHHNMKPFGRGSVREGWTPAESAGVELPTHDWLELLKMTASKLGKTLVPAADAAA